MLNRSSKKTIKRKNTYMVKQGDVYLVDCTNTINGMEGIHYVVVISNNEYHRYYNNAKVVPLTSKKLNKLYPHEVLIQSDIRNGLSVTSKAMPDKSATVPMNPHLTGKTKVGHVNEYVLLKLLEANTKTTSR